MKTATASSILRWYRFPDGLKICFMDDRRNHLKVLPSETLELHVSIDKQVFKEMKISYQEWKKRYCKG